MLKIRSGPSALAISALALFISMGGTGYAQTQHAGTLQASQSAPSAAAARLHAWHGLTLTGGWVFGALGSDRPAYYKDAFGVVHLRGSAVGGNTALFAFQLPRGARPSHTLWLSIYASNGSSGGLEILPSGRSLLFDNNGGVDAANWSSLDGVSFPVP
jgi:hypothetical protein